MLKKEGEGDERKGVQGRTVEDDAYCILSNI